MPFSKGCSFKLHKPKDRPHSFYNLENRKDVPNAVRLHVVSNLLLTSSRSQRDSYLCNICIKRVEDELQIEPKKSKTKQSDLEEDLDASHISLDETKTNITDALETVIEAIRDGALSNDQENLLLKAIGDKVRSELQQEPFRDSITRQDDIMCNNYLEAWKSQQDGFLKKLIESFGNRSAMDATTARKMMKTKELIHWIVEPRYISNISMGEALLLMNFAHSKLAVDLLGKLLPVGSFTTLRRTLSAMDTGEATIPNNDVIFAFDNNQRVGRQWSIRYQGKQPVSTITALIYFDMGANNRNQFGDKIQTAVFPTQENKTILQQSVKKLSQSSNATHRFYRSQVIKQCIADIINDTSIFNMQIVDSVTKEETNPVFNKILDYTRVPRKDRFFPVSDLDCMDLNPNSFESLREVLDKLIEYADKDGRSYVHVVVDGHPYQICQKLLQQTYICSECQQTLSGSDVDNHQEAEHPFDDVQLSRKYRKILLRPGAGHVDSNSCRLLLSMFFDPFIKPFAMFMGYKTESNLQFCKRGTDHHRTYDLLMVIYSALSLELISEYVGYCLKIGKEPTYDDFCFWEKEKSKHNLTFAFAMDFAFTSLHSLHLWRSAIRMCNDDVAFHARQKLASHFYISNCKKYQEILTQDMLYLLSLPSEVQKQIGIESSRGASGQVGEGFDYLLENRNRLFKSFLPTDSCPDYWTWRHVSRIAGKLEKLRDNSANRCEMRDDLYSHHHRNLSLEILQARKYIRSLNLLNQEKLAFFSFEETPRKLDPSSLGYLTDAYKNQESYYAAYLENQKLNTTIVSFLEDEIGNIENLSVTKMTSLVNAKVMMLHQPFQSIYKTTLKKSKTIEELVELYRSVRFQLQFQNEADADILSLDDYCMLEETAVM